MIKMHQEKYHPLALSKDKLCRLNKTSSMPSLCLPISEIVQQQHLEDKPLFSVPAKPELKQQEWV
jgi:hypothetical protein